MSHSTWIKSHLAASKSKKERKMGKVSESKEVNRSNEEDWVEHKMTHDTSESVERKVYNESGNSSSIAQVTKVNIICLIPSNDETKLKRNQLKELQSQSKQSKRIKSIRVISRSWWTCFESSLILPFCENFAFNHLRRVPNILDKIIVLIKWYP